jgi:hypothetical protein
MALGFAPCSELAIGIAGYELYKVRGVIRCPLLCNLTRRSSQLPLVQPQPLLINHNTLPFPTTPTPIITMPAGGCVCGNVRYEAVGDSAASVRSPVSCDTVRHTDPRRRFSAIALTAVRSPARPTAPTASTMATRSRSPRARPSSTRRRPTRAMRLSPTSGTLPYLFVSIDISPDIDSGDCGSTMWREGAAFPGKKIVKVCFSLGCLTLAGRSNARSSEPSMTPASWTTSRSTRSCSLPSGQSGWASSQVPIRRKGCRRGIQTPMSRDR